MYYAADDLPTAPWVDGEHGGEVRCATGHVMAPGSIHPNGELYSVLIDAPIVPGPAYVRNLKAYRLPVKSGPMEKIPEGGGRHAQLTSVAGKLRASGLDADAIHAALIPINEAICADPVSDADLEHIAESVSRYAVREPDAIAVFKAGQPKEPVDPLSFFDNPDQILNAEPVDFVVNSIIPKNRYTGFVALSGSRKTIIACNLVRSVLTGEPFLGKFPVDCTPERVLLFAAESARSELKERMENLGLVSFLQSRKLLIRSAAANGSFHQDQIPESLLAGSLCIFDTFARFFDGTSEQDSVEARKFSAQMQRIVNAGATVIVLFHAPKGARGAEMTIESIRGSSELGNAMACCWSLAMLGPDWKDNTRMSQVKRREFECNPAEFDFSCDLKTTICTYVDGVHVTVGTGTREAEDAQAVEFLNANRGLSDRAVAIAFKAKTGIYRSYKWFQRLRKRGQNLGTGTFDAL
jgi:hypothetical protein